MKTALFLLALSSLPLAAQTAEGRWACEAQITGNPVIPGTETQTDRFTLDILPDGTATGAGTREDGTGQHPFNLTATWVLEGQNFSVKGTMGKGATGVFAFASDFVSAYDMALDKTFGSGVRYTSACEKLD